MTYSTQKPVQKKYDSGKAVWGEHCLDVVSLINRLCYRTDGWRMVSCECNAEARVGLRVAVGKNHGTVRYEGEVPPTKGKWLGIEWDDPTRGKHDGVYNSVRYFHTR